MLNIPKTQWDGVVNDPVPWTFLTNNQRTPRNAEPLECITFGGCHQTTRSSPIDENHTTCWLS